MLDFRQCFAEAYKAMGRKPTAGDEYSNAYAFYDKPAAGEESAGGDVCVVMKENGKRLNMQAYAITPNKEFIRSFDITDDGEPVTVEID